MTITIIFTSYTEILKKKSLFEGFFHAVCEKNAKNGFSTQNFGIEKLFFFTWMQDKTKDLSLCFLTSLVEKKTIRYIEIVQYWEI